MTAPSGTVTLLFSDIEGSTRLWETHGDRMEMALARHDALLRSAIEEARGHVFKAVGDGFCTVFTEAADAVAGAVAAQRALLAEPWPEGLTVRVRMGLHSGACVQRDADYFGPAVNRVARLMAVAHGGQVVLSSATRELLADGLPDKLSLRELGEHRLKDLGRPERVYQVCGPGLPDAFPPLRSLDNPALLNNLPLQSTTFVGRGTELAELADLLSTGRSRVVTLTGAGGVGKTRLSLQVAAELVDGSGDGVWLVELAPLTDPDLVAPSVASVIGVREEGGHPILDTLVDAIADRRLLIVLDNCEQVVGAAAKLVDRLMRGCPRVSVLASSREPLGIDGEYVYRVPALAVPAGDDLGPGQAALYEAVELFVDRARTQKHGFTLDASNTRAVLDLCTRLDGIPLAIELAAARLRSMTVADLDRRLDQRFRLLNQGARNALPHHQTLQALIDWSYDLLNGDEKLVLDRLSVFAGGWTLDAAEAVAGAGDIEDWGVLDHLSTLVDKSLVQTDEGDDAMRYRLLETVRHYAVERLAERGDVEQASTRARHRDHYLAIAEAAAPELFARDQVEWLDRLETEHDNLRAALAFCVNQPDEREAGMRLAVALRWFWETRGHRSEGAEALAHLLDSPEIGADSVLRAEGLNASSALLERLGDLGSSAARAEEARALADVLGDRALAADALKQVVWISIYRGDAATALQQADNVVELAGQAGDPHLLARCLNARAVARAISGDLDAARRDYEQALGISRSAGDHRRVAVTLTNLGYAELLASDEAGARTHLDEAASIAEDMRDPTLLSYLSGLLGLIEALSGDADDARRRLAESFTMACRVGLKQQMANATLGAALVRAKADPLLAATLHGVADQMIEQGERSFEPVEAELRQGDVSRLREVLGEAPFSESYEKGHRLLGAEAVAFVRTQLSGGRKDEASGERSGSATTL